MSDSSLSIPLSFRVVEMHATEQAHCVVLQENPRPHFAESLGGAAQGRQAAETPPTRTVVEVSRPTFASCFLGMVLELVPAPVQPGLGGGPGMGPSHDSINPGAFLRGRA